MDMIRTLSILADLPASVYSLLIAFQGLRSLMMCLVSLWFFCMILGLFNLNWLNYFLLFLFELGVAILSATNLPAHCHGHYCSWYSLPATLTGTNSNISNLWIHTLTSHRRRQCRKRGWKRCNTLTHHSKRILIGKQKLIRYCNVRDLTREKAIKAERTAEVIKAYRDQVAREKATKDKERQEKEAAIRAIQEEKDREIQRIQREEEERISKELADKAAAETAEANALKDSETTEQGGDSPAEINGESSGPALVDEPRTEENW
jgi:hypothetical protein